MSKIRHLDRILAVIEAELNPPKPRPMDAKPCRTCEKPRPSCEARAYGTICEDCWVVFAFNLRSKNASGDRRSTPRKQPRHAL